MLAAQTRSLAPSSPAGRPRPGPRCPLRGRDGAGEVVDRRCRPWRCCRPRRAEGQLGKPLRIIFNSLHGNTWDGAGEKLFLPALSLAKFDPRSLAPSRGNLGRKAGITYLSPCSPGKKSHLTQGFSREMASPGSLPGSSPCFSPGIGLSRPLGAEFVTGLLPESAGFVPGLLPVPVTRTCPRVLPGLPAPAFLPASLPA